MAKSRLHELRDHGVSPWIDSVSREMLETGELKRLMDEDAVVGVTSNPTIFQKAMAEGEWYDEQLAEAAKESDDLREIFIALAVEDIKQACDLMKPAWDASGGVDGYVSIEVDPTLAYDRDATYAQAMRLHGEVDRPNVYVTIPATEVGLGPIEDCIAATKSINVTLIFSLDRYRAVVEAYLRGLERAVASGRDVTTVRSVASFFVSRVDTEADKRLEAIGNTTLQGKLAIANAKLAYETYREVFMTPEWEALEAKGATKQRCLWASTGVKNPDYKDTVYVEELVGPDTVNTMPRELVEAVLDHGEIRGDTLLENPEEASRILDQYESAGVSYDDVVATLEREGVEKFSKSFADLIEGLESKLKLVAA